MDFEWPDNLICDPILGELRRVFKNGPKLISTMNSQGYIVVWIEGRLYRAHRLIWLFETGAWPENDVDHINGRRDDNRFINLRDATKSENSRNAKIRSDNTSGVKGVGWSKGHNMWSACISVGGKQKRLGLFIDLDEAKKVVQTFREEHHGAFVNHGSY